MPVEHIRSTIVNGDAFNPSDCDIIAQEGTLAVGEPVPYGWRVLSGHQHASFVVRIGYRMEFENNK